jgi:hypothetical protein
VNVGIRDLAQGQDQGGEFGKVWGRQCGLGGVNFLTQNVEPGERLGDGISFVACAVMLEAKFFHAGVDFDLSGFD